MNFPQKILLSSLILIASLKALAMPGDDALWTQARKTLGASQNIVAGSLHVDMEMFGDDGKSLGTLQVQEKLSEWKDGEPVRKMVSISNEEYVDIAKKRFSVIVDNHPDMIMTDIANVERLNQDVINGKKCVVYKFSGKAGKKNSPFKARIWIDELAGVPLKTVFEFTLKSPVKSWINTIHYGTNEAGVWAPSGATVDVTVNMLFQEVRTISKYKFSDWLPRTDQKM